MTLEIEGKVLKELKPDKEGVLEPGLKKLKRKEKLEKFTKGIRKNISEASRKKLKMKKILRKGKRATVVVNVAPKPRTQIQNMMKESIQEDRRNFFFR